VNAYTQSGQHAQNPRPSRRRRGRSPADDLLWPEIRPAQSQRL